VVYDLFSAAADGCGGRHQHHPTNLRCLLDINSIGPVQGSRHRFHGWPNLLILPLWPRHAGSNRWAINQNYFHISSQLVRPRGTVRWPRSCFSVTGLTCDERREESWVVATPFRWPVTTTSG